MLGEAIGLTFSNRVLELDAPGNVFMDGLPVVLTGQTTAAFPGVLQTLQGAGHWLPADCGGQPCDYGTNPTAIAVSVNYVGAGNTPAGNSVQRKLGIHTMQNSDWYAAGAGGSVPAQSFGSPNVP